MKLIVGYWIVQVQVFFGKGNEQKQVRQMPTYNEQVLIENRYLHWTGFDRK